MTERFVESSEPTIDDVVFHGGINPYTQFNLALTVPVGSSASEVAGKLRLTNFTEALQLHTCRIGYQ